MMQKPKNSVVGVKAAICALYEKEVTVRVDRGRNRVVEYVGKLTGIYPALFTVTPLHKKTEKTAYSYAEVLCGKVAVRGKE